MGFSAFPTQPIPGPHKASSLTCPLPSPRRTCLIPRAGTLTKTARTVSGPRESPNSRLNIRKLYRLVTCRSLVGAEALSVTPEYVSPERPVFMFVVWFRTTPPIITFTPCFILLVR